MSELAESGAPVSSLVFEIGLPAGSEQEALLESQSLPSALGLLGPATLLVLKRSIAAVEVDFKVFRGACGVEMVARGDLGSVLMNQGGNGRVTSTM